MKLEGDRITVRLGERDVLRDVSVSVAAGEMVAIVGPNGCGKSTLVRSLLGLLPTSGGDVLLDGTPIRRLSARRVARLVALVGQTPSDAPSLTVAQHVALGRHAHMGWLRGPSVADREIVDEAIHRFGLEPLAGREVGAISGGERQRVRLATAVAQRPRILILDEPMTGLDVEHQLELLDTLAAICQGDSGPAAGGATGGGACGEVQRAGGVGGVGVVCVLHHLDHAVRYFPRSVALRDGRVVADGATNQTVCPAVLQSTFRVNGCVSCDRDRGLPVVVCERLRSGAAST